MRCDVPHCEVVRRKTPQSTSMRGVAPRFAPLRLTSLCLILLHFTVIMLFLLIFFLYPCFIPLHGAAARLISPHIDARVPP